MTHYNKQMEDNVTVGNETEHVQVPFTISTGQEVLVDEGMVGVLSEFKRLGLKTMFSCQESIDGSAYVMFRAGRQRKLVKEIFRGWCYSLEFRTTSGSYRAFEYTHLNEERDTWFLSEWLTFNEGRRYVADWLASDTDEFITYLKSF